MDIKTTYVKDNEGNDIAVILDINTFKEIQEMIEDIEDIKIIESIMDEPTISLDKVERTLSEKAYSN